MKQSFAMVLVMAACGSKSQPSGVDSGSVDSNGSDAPIFDASLSDAPANYACDPNTPAGPVTVWSYFPGFTVLSHDASGKWLGGIYSGGYTTQIDVPGCGAVTYLDHEEAGRLTVMAVQPGDTIFRPGFFPSTMTANIVLDQPAAGASYYFANGGPSCVGSLAAGAGSNLSVYYSSLCQQANGTSTVLVRANSTPPQYAVFPDVSLAQASQTPLHVTSWQTGPIHHLTANLATATPALGMQWLLASLDHGFTYDGEPTVVNATGSTFDANLQYAEFGDAVMSHVKFVYANTQTREIQQVFPTPFPAQVTTQFESQLLPFVRDPIRDNDPERPTLSFVVDSNVVDEDMVVVGVPVARPGVITSTWVVIAPPGTRSVRLPELPAQLRVTFYAPTTSVSAQIKESTDVAGYAQARQDPVRLLNLTKLVTATGTVVRQSSVEFH